MNQNHQLCRVGMTRNLSVQPRPIRVKDHFCGHLQRKESKSSGTDSKRNDGDSFEDDVQTYISGASSIIQKVPVFTVGDNTPALRREKIERYLQNLAGVEVSDHVIKDYLLMAKNPHMGVTFRVKDFTKEVLPDFITGDPRLWTVLAKTEVENTEVDLAELNEGPLTANKGKAAALTEVDYRYMAKHQPEYPEVDINDDLWAIAKITFPAFRWQFRIGG